MAKTLVKYEHQSPAVVITLNRPEKRNALSRELITQLTDAFAEVKTDEKARCVILTGEGTVFCAGMDLAELQASVEQGMENSPVWDDAQRLSQLYESIYSLPKPTIAAVSGAAVAGGAGMVSVCDIAVCSDSARFGYPEVRRGLVAAMVMPHLMRHVGERMARYLLLTGELIDAATAKSTGFVNEVVSAEELMPQAMKWASAIAEGGPNALRLTKELLGQFSQQSTSIEETAKASAAPRLTEECQQGLKAFFAKEPVPWSVK